MLSPRRGTRELARIGPLEVVAHFGVLPEQVPDFKALSGDSSDKIPGARGVGPKSAASLLLKHGDLEGVLRSWGRPGDAELVLMFREVVRCGLTSRSRCPPRGRRIGRAARRCSWSSAPSNSRPACWRCAMSSVRRGCLNWTASRGRPKAVAHGVAALAAFVKGRRLASMSRTLVQAALILRQAQERAVQVG